MESESVARLLQDFLSGSRDAVVLEDGAVIFDLSQAKYSVAAEYGKCLLQFWSAERNVVRRVVEAEVSKDMLRLLVQRLGQARPSKLEICRDRDRRSPSERRTIRALYRRSLERVIARTFPAWKTEAA